MRITVLIARLLLGLIFFVFGLNGFLHFIPNMPLPDPAIKFIGALVATPYMPALLFGDQAISGILLLSGRFVPLALALLAPVVVNIFFFHFFLAPGGIGLAIIVAVLFLFLVWTNRSAYASMLRP